MEAAVFNPSAAVTSAVLIASVVSLIATLFIVLSFLRHKILRRHPAELVLYRCLADALFCLVTVGSHIFLRSDAAATSGVDCKAFSFIAQAATMAGELYYLAMSLDLHISMTNPFTNYRRNVRTYHVLTWGIALGSAVALVLVKINKQRCYGSDNFISVCWIRNFVDDTPSGAPIAPGTSSTSRPIAAPFWIFFFVPLVVIYSAALVLLWKASRRLRQGLPETFSARVDIFRDTLRFNVGYLVFWAVALAVYALIALIDSRNPSNFLSLLLALTFCSKGSVTALIWLLTFGKDLSFTCRRGCVPKAEIVAASASSTSSRQAPQEGTAGAAAAPSADLRPFLNVNLRREVLYYTTMGIAKSVARASREGTSLGEPGPASNVDLDEDYGRYGIRVNVLWLSRRKEESGLFDLEANKAKSKQAVLAAANASSSGDVRQPRLQLHASRSGRQVLSSPPTDGAEERGVVKNSVVSGTVDAFLSWKSGPAHATAPQTPSKDLRPPINRSASDMRMPLLSPAREHEVQEEMVKTQHQGKASAGQHLAAGSGRLVEFEPSLRSANPTMSLNAGAAAASGTIANRVRSSHSVASRGSRMLRTSAPKSRPSYCGSCWGSSAWSSSSSALPRYKFTDFEPFLFRRLRLQAGISDVEYVLALSRTRREKFSEGASSQFFYFSTDERMLVKTLDHAEVDVLLSMLHAYSQYLSREPHSLLPRFYGLHSITMYGATFFCVMANVLASGSASIQDRYDLKGSWVNRHRSPLEKGQRAECRYCGQRFRVGDGGSKFATDSAGKGSCPARVNKPHEPNVVLKDNDLNAKLRLLPETAQALGDQIARDCDFLRSQGVMDYSLLLGVHRTKYKLVDAPPPALTSSANQPTASGMATRACLATASQPAGTEVQSYVDGTRRSTIGPFVQPETSSAASVTSSDMPLESLSNLAGEAAAAVGDRDHSVVSDAVGPESSMSGGPIPSIALVTAVQGGQVVNANAHLTSAPWNGNALRNRDFFLSDSEPHVVVPFHREYRGGLRATVIEGPGIYYAGLIDILQRFTWAKWFERACKVYVLFKNGNGLSSMEPGGYAQRFKTRVLGQLLDGWKDNTTAASACESSDNEGAFSDDKIVTGESSAVKNGSMDDHVQTSSSRIWSSLP